MANKDLKTCPHCGCLAWITVDNSIFAGQHYPDYPGQTKGYRVECQGKCHSMTCWWHTEKQAQETWNMRVNDE
ncbi:hypothetical protein KAR91_43545 [Candidatus Pacearchaeota archaeon]|nr:hypothetical protein [Candidatus Pacearchaeota archaeon]